MSDGAYLYILRCVDGSYYAGTARSSLKQRVAEHNAGTYGGYTAQRRPVTLVFSQWFDRITDAIAAERQVKGWSRAKKEALMRGDFSSLQQLSKRRQAPKTPHRARVRSPMQAPPPRRIEPHSVSADARVSAPTRTW